MNPKAVFWIPIAIRSVLVLLAGGVIWYLFSLIWALGFLLLAALSVVAMQLSYLNKLAIWLDHPHSAKLPDGWGAWTDIFSRLYRLRRDDEKNQTELSEWLARFRQAMHLLPDGVVIMDDVLF